MVHPLIVIGSKGFIGRHFCHAFPQALQIDRSQLDLSDPCLTFSTEGRKIALITAGVGNPKRCEEDPSLSYHCNVAGTLKVGKELLKRGILPIFFSTDYVFDDNLNVSPLNAYGRQKAELEKEALALDALVIRLSKVYGIEKGDRTLFDEMADTLTQGNRIQAAYDQVFSPIFVGDVVQQVMALIEKGKRGIVNVFGPSFASRLEMARKVAEKLGVKSELIKEISLDDLKDGICRPKQLALSSDFPAMNWDSGVECVVKNYA